jgi:hypothetical protein
LSRILVDASTVPHRFFLSRKACEGILRRVERKKKTLPPLLLRVLKATAQG